MTRILTPTDRATIRRTWTLYHGSQVDDVLALLDTCDAMQAVIRRLMADGHDWWPDENGCHWDDIGPLGDVNRSEPMSPAEAAVLDTIREDHTDGT